MALKDAQEAFNFVKCMPDSHSGADNFQVTRQGAISVSTRLTTSASVNLLLHICGSTRGPTVRKSRLGEDIVGGATYRRRKLN
jgi:hypothetical protein